jgi:hypothetical protein
MFDDDNEEDNENMLPLEFHETGLENDLTDDIRGGIAWASIQRFLTDEDLQRRVKERESEFTEKHKSLAKSVMFLGPFPDAETAVTTAQRRKGAIVVVPKHLIEAGRPLIYIAALGN